MLAPFWCAISIWDCSFSFILFILCSLAWIILVDLLQNPLIFSSVSSNLTLRPTKDDFLFLLLHLLMLEYLFELFFFKHQLSNIFYLVIHYSLLLINSLGCGALKILYVFKYLIWNLQLVHLTSGPCNGQFLLIDFFFLCKGDNSMLLCMFQKFFIEKQTYKIIQYNSSGNQTQNLLLFVCLFV